MSAPRLQRFLCPVALRPLTTPLRLSALLLTLLHTGAFAQSGRLAHDLQLLAQGQRFERRISLSTLGLPGPSINIPAGSVQEFYFPAHAADRSRSLQVVTPANQPAPLFTLNGAPLPVQAAAPASPGQLLNAQLPLNASAAQARLGMQVAPAAQTTCDAVPAGAVALNSSSYLSYYPAADDASTPQSWAQGIAALPERPFLMVASPPLSPEVFDTAWRVGVAMARVGRRVAVHPLPRVGDKVDTRTLSIPASLKSMPAFASLADATADHTIENPAEIGALLMLDAADTLADVVVVDRQLQGQIGRALDALQNQIADDEAMAVFQQWRDRKMPLARTDVQTASMVRIPFGAHPVWAVSSQGAASVAPMNAGPSWQLLSAVADGGARLATQQAAHPILSPANVASPNQFAVHAPENWSGTFALVPPGNSRHTPSSVQASFQLPAQSKEQHPVGVLRWNGILLAARKLSAGSERESLSASIPAYALADINLLQVSVEQSAPAGDCKQAITVPTSALQLDVRFDAPAASTLPDDPTFAELIPSLGEDAEIAVPKGYLSEARTGLSNTIRMAVAANLSTHSAHLVLVESDKPYAPTRPFVALDVAVQHTDRQLNLVGNNITFKDRSVDGLPWKPNSDVSAVQTVTSGQQAGLLWYPLGEDATLKSTGLLVNHGRVALLGPASEVAWVDPSGSVVHASDANTAGPMYEWRSLFSWGVPVTLTILVLFIALLIAAMVASRVERRKTQTQEGTP